MAGATSVVAVVMHRSGLTSRAGETWRAATSMGYANGAGLLLGMALLGRLPRLWPTPAYDPRFSNDRFGVAVRCAEHDGDVLACLDGLPGDRDVLEGLAGVGLQDRVVAKEFLDGVGPQRRVRVQRRHRSRAAA